MKVFDSKKKKIYYFFLYFIYFFWKLEHFQTTLRYLIVYLEQFVANGDVLEVGGVPVVGANEGPDAGGEEDHHGVGAAMGLVFALLIALEFLPVLVVGGQTVNEGLKSWVLRLISFGMRLGGGGGVKFN